MKLSEEEALDRFQSARVAHLATVNAAGQPHLVPVTFALWSAIVVIATDHKPKTTTNLRRRRNIQETGRVSLLTDDYDDHDWSRLWWVRVDGTARLVDDEQERAEAIRRLCDKYRQYRAIPPAGPVTWVDIDALTSWAYQG
ncbi:MAG: TIGR03668 family PPOX class F420-dependent oxidoreductase [Pseudonocardiaceae bacterium]